MLRRLCGFISCNGTTLTGELIGLTVGLASEASFASGFFEVACVDEVGVDDGFNFLVLTKLFEEDKVASYFPEAVRCRTLKSW